MVKSCKLSVITSTGTLLLFYVRKNYIIFTAFFLRNNHFRNTVESQEHENNTSRNNTSDIIVHSLHGQFFGIRRNKQYLRENDT